MRLKLTYRKMLKALLLVAFLLVGGVNAIGQNVNYKSQSLYLYKFTKHITWPVQANSGDFIIAVYGNSPIVPELEIMASIKKAANGRKIRIKRINSVNEIGDAHIVYLTSSKSRELRNLVEQLGDSPVLVVGERGGLARKGASINFLVMENDNLRFEVNKAELKNRSLVISDDLLKLGFVVR